MRFERALQWWCTQVASVNISGVRAWEAEGGREREREREREKRERQREGEGDRYFLNLVRSKKANKKEEKEEKKKVEWAKKSGQEMSLLKSSL